MYSICPLPFFTQRYSGEIGSRVTLNDKVARLLSGELANAVLNVIVVFFFAVLMFTYDMLLTSIGVVMATLNVLALQSVSRARKDGSRRLINENGKLLGTTTSGISMIESLKASGRENDFFMNWSGYLAKVINAQQELGWLTIRLNIIPPLLMSLNTTIILGVGAMRVMSGQMTLGMLVAFLYLMENFMRPVNQLVSVGSLFQEADGDMNRIDDVLNYEISEEFGTQKSKSTKPEEDNIIDDTSSFGNKKQQRDNSDTLVNNKLIGYLEIQNLSFGYSKAMPALVENFSLKLMTG